MNVCPDCRYVPPTESDDDDIPGYPVCEQYQEVHRADCPRVALSKEGQARIAAKIESSYRCRGRAAAEARTAWIG